MEKKKFTGILQLAAIIVFVVMALSCYSSKTAVTDSEEGSRSLDGAFIQEQVDSVSIISDLAMQ